MNVTVYCTEQGFLLLQGCSMVGMGWSGQMRSMMALFMGAGYGHGLY